MSKFTQLDFLCRQLSEKGIKVSISNGGYFNGKNQPIASYMDSDGWFTITYNKKEKNKFSVVYGNNNQSIFESSITTFQTINQTLDFILNLKK